MNLENWIEQEMQVEKAEEIKRSKYSLIMGSMMAVAFGIVIVGYRKHNGIEDQNLLFGLIAFAIGEVIALVLGLPNYKGKIKKLKDTLLKELSSNEEQLQFLQEITDGSIEQVRYEESKRKYWAKFTRHYILINASNAYGFVVLKNVISVEQDKIVSKGEVQGYTIWIRTKDTSGREARQVLNFKDRDAFLRIFNMIRSYSNSIDSVVG